MTKLDKYDKLSVYTVRKCPDCGSKDYERSIVFEHITRRVNGKTVYYKSGGENGHTWKCLNCGLMLLHSWVGVEPDRDRQKEEYRNSK